MKLRWSFGAGGGGRTRTVSLPQDFESSTSANSITPACEKTYIHYTRKSPVCQGVSRGYSRYFIEQFTGTQMSRTCAGLPIAQTAGHSQQNAERNPAFVMFQNAVQSILFPTGFHAAGVHGSLLSYGGVKMHRIQSGGFPKYRPVLKKVELTFIITPPGFVKRKTDFSAKKQSVCRKTHLAGRAAEG